MRLSKEYRSFINEWFRDLSKMSRKKKKEEKKTGPIWIKTLNPQKYL